MLVCTTMSVITSAIVAGTRNQPMPASSRTSKKKNAIMAIQRMPITEKLLRPRETPRNHWLPSATDRASRSSASDASASCPALSRRTLERRPSKSSLNRIALGSSGTRRGSRISARGLPSDDSVTAPCVASPTSVAVRCSVR